MWLGDAAVPQARAQVASRPVQGAQGARLAGALTLAPTLTRSVAVTLTRALALTQTLTLTLTLALTLTLNLTRTRTLTPNQGARRAEDARVLRGQGGAPQADELLTLQP